MSDLPPIRPVESPGTAPGDEEGRPWWSTILAALGLGSAEGTGGLGVSLAVHGVVLLAMALWAVDAHVEGRGLMLSVFPGTEETVQLEEISTLADLAGGSPTEITAPPLELIPDEGEGIPIDLTAAVAGGGEGAGAGDDLGDELGADGTPQEIVLRGGGKAIRKGSFTVWTIPPDPRPMQDYAIVIEVDLPEELRLRRYPKRDLYGEVRGTDSFHKRLPGDNFQDRIGFLPIRNGKVQFVVGIPGAESLVKDRIKVGSKLLNESQTLELVF